MSAPAPSSLGKADNQQPRPSHRTPRQRNVGGYHRGDRGSHPLTPRTASAVERFGPLLEPFGISKNQIRRLMAECDHDVETMALKVNQLVDTKLSAEQNENEWQAVSKPSSSKMSARSSGRRDDAQQPSRREGGNFRGGDNHRGGKAAGTSSSRYRNRSDNGPNGQPQGGRKSFGDRQNQRDARATEVKSAEQAAATQPAPQPQKRSEIPKGPTWADRVRGVKAATAASPADAKELDELTRERREASAAPEQLVQSVVAEQPAAEAEASRPATPVESPTVVPLAAPPATGQSWASKMRGERPASPVVSEPAAAAMQQVLGAPAPAPAVPTTELKQDLEQSLLAQPVIEQPTHPAAVTLPAPPIIVESHPQPAIPEQVLSSMPPSPADTQAAEISNLPSSGRPTILRRPPQPSPIEQAQVPAPMHPQMVMPLSQHPEPVMPPMGPHGAPQDIVPPVGYSYNMPPPGVYWDNRGIPVASDYYSQMYAPPQPQTDMRSSYMMRQPHAPPQPPAARDMYNAPPASYGSYYPDYMDRRYGGYGRQAQQQPAQHQPQPQPSQGPAGFMDATGYGMPPIYMMATEQYSKSTPRSAEQAPQQQQTYGQYAAATAAARQEYNMPSRSSGGYYSQGTDLPQHMQSRATDQAMHRQGMDQPYGQQSHYSTWGHY